jgi:formylglycine-generating enzyme required for sulfatase activity
MAFCYWLSWKIGALPDLSVITQRILGAIRLPTEQEWQHASQTDTKRFYPWGKKFDVTKCNCRESGHNRPVDVTFYPEGQSALGVYQMSGNVCEWCLTAWGRDDLDIASDQLRVLRGGAWQSGGDYCNGIGRDYFTPTPKNIIGFRCAYLP